jgi:hypothetical protein
MSNDSNATTPTNGIKEEQEGAKLLHDACKHLTTLSSGSIVILATFLTKAPILHAKSFLIAALILLVISVASSSWAIFNLAVYVRDYHNKKKATRYMEHSIISISVAIVTFLFGLITLVIFIIWNV